LTDVTFEARGAVRTLFRERPPSVVLSGPAGTGKSVGALMYVHLQMLSNGAARAVMLRKTHASLTASTLVSFRQKVAKEAIAAGIVRFYGGSAQEPPAFRYRNGATITVGGMDRSTRVLSTEFDIALIDEATEMTEEDLDTIDGRLRNGALPVQQMIMCTNPGAPTHHLKARCDDGRSRMLYSRHVDNPRMYQDGQWTDYGRTYLGRLDNLRGVRRKRFMDGLWVAAEDVVFDEWDPAVHVVDRFVPPEAWPRYWAIDWGFNNPSTVQFWAIDPDGTMWLYREIYHTQWTADRLARECLKHVTRDGSRTGVWTEPKPKAIIADHDSGDRALFSRELGLPTRAADKRVKLGLQVAKNRLKIGANGKPRMYVMAGSLVSRDRDLADQKLPTCLIDEMTSYEWDRRPGHEDEPVKRYDHACDPFRYLSMRLDPPSGGRAKFHSPTALGTFG
jgi:PBSX family phage terminase large subunit